MSRAVYKLKAFSQMRAIVRQMDAYISGVTSEDVSGTFDPVTGGTLQTWGHES